jgi:hypothetical protein
VRTVEVWLAGGSADGWLQLVETDETAGLLTTVVLPQTGVFLGADDDPARGSTTSTGAPTTSTASPSTATNHRRPPHRPPASGDQKRTRSHSPALHCHSQPIGVVVDHDTRGDPRLQARRAVTPPGRWVGVLDRPGHRRRVPPVDAVLQHVASNI